MDSWPTALLAALAVALALAPATPATAATAEGTRELVETYRGEEYYEWDISYTAAPGEANRLVVSPDGGSVTFKDAGAPIEAGRGCTSTAPDRAVCAPPEGIRYLRVRLGDGGDTVRVDGEQSLLEVYGGAGDDLIEGGIDGEDLFGGPGDDLVDGGGGGDSIDGGGGRDELRAGTPADGYDFIEDGDTDAEPAADVIIGRADGYQTIVSYRARRRPITVDLRAGTAGRPGEGDKLVGIRHIEAGEGDDVIRGSDDGDYIRANDGADRIYGRAGNDSLLGQAGADRTRGGPGDDRVTDDSDDARDVHRCGSGRDWVTSSDARDLLRGSCEDGAWRVSPDIGEPNPISVRPRIGARRAFFRSGCTNYSHRCTGRISLRTPGTRKLLGRGRIEIRRTSTDRVKVPLNRRGRARLRRGGYVRVVIAARYDCNGCLNPPKAHRTGFTTYMRR